MQSSLNKPDYLWNSFDLKLDSSLPHHGLFVWVLLEEKTGYNVCPSKQTTQTQIWFPAEEKKERLNT